MRRTLVLLLFGLPLCRALPAVAATRTMPIERHSSRDAYAKEIAEAAERFQLSASWIRAVLRAESAGDPRAISPRGALGLMQIMPKTWRELRVRYRLGDDPYDPRGNIMAGAAYMRELFDRYGSPGFLAAYTAGPSRYEASLGGRPLPAETEAYVRALAPIVDGQTVARSVTAAVIRPPSLSHSPLFVAQADDAFLPVPVSAQRPPTVPRSAISVHDVSAIEPQSAGLFVARSQQGIVR